MAAGIPRVGIGLALAISTIFTSSTPAFGSICISGGSFLAPEAGATLPENPRLFLFVRDSAGQPIVDVHADSAEAAFEVAAVSTLPAFSAYRIDVTAGAGERLTVRVREAERERTLRASYLVTRSAPTPRVPLRVLDVETILDEGCYYFEASQTIRISAPMAASSPIPAFRIEWAFDAAALAAGRSQSFVLPANMAGFPGNEPGVGGTLMLGTAGCSGTTLEWKPGTPVYLSITALHEDRTEQPVTLDAGVLELAPPERSLGRALAEDHLAPAVWKLTYLYSEAYALLVP